MDKLDLDESLSATQSEARTADSDYVGLAAGYLLSKRKRLVDLFVGVFGLLIVGLMLLPLSIIIIVASGFPVFYRRERLGIHGRVFIMVKFRTMVNLERQSGLGLRTVNDDPRISFVGRLLRKSYIDELPQFWNVIKGDMSVVGPRPEFPELAIELTRIRKQFPKRLNAKPGLTGLAQIRYVHSHDNAHAAGRLPYDLEYTKRASFLVDLWIIWQTILKTIRFSGT
jgi:lipopolysaccharide/colanic/teichoic acid biosynthesis glycosyltransferase